jgi:hypothetical protein
VAEASYVVFPARFAPQAFMLETPAVAAAAGGGLQAGHERQLPGLEDLIPQVLKEGAAAPVADASCP